jgi:hypothetical protein
MVIQKFFRYKVRENDELTLRLVVGYGQLAATTISIGGQYLASAEAKSTIEIKIPKKGKDLIKHTLVCISTVKDIQSITDKTSITYTLSGGPEKFEKPLNAIVEENGGVLNYIVEFDFELESQMEE